MLSSSDRRNKRAASEDLQHLLGYSSTSERAKRLRSSSKKKMRKRKFELPKYSSKCSPAKGIQAISEENTRNSLPAEEAPEEEHSHDNDAEGSDNMLSVQLPSTGNLNISSSLGPGNEPIDENADDEEDEGSWHGSAIPIDFTGAKKPTVFDGTFDESELESVGNEHDDEGDEETGTKAEADINGRKVYKKLKKLEQAIRTADTAALQESVVEDLGDIHFRLAALERHHKLSEARATARHDMIFGVLKQISQDINRSNTSSQIDGAKVGSPEPARAASTAPLRADKTADERMAKARQSVEHCLESYMDQMSKSNDVETIKTLGQLCVKYADTLFRSFL